MGRTEIVCKDCGKHSIIHAKGRCNACSTRYWRQTAIREKKECPRCKKMRPHHAKGYCRICYNFVFCMDTIVRDNVKKNHGIDMETYNKVTKECLLCGFFHVVDLHHMDKNRLNTSPENLVGLCPNHHRMIHCFKHKDEIEAQIRG